MSSWLIMHKIKAFLTGFTGCKQILKGPNKEWKYKL